MFESESEANAYFEKKLEEIRNIRIRQKNPKKPNFPDDPISKKMRHDNPKVVESVSDEVYGLTHKDHHREMERIESQVGRYPTGFRHFENYEFYNLHHPDATMVDYQEAMNKQCEFHEFVEIMRAALVEQSNTPGFKFDTLSITQERLDEGYSI